LKKVIEFKTNKYAPLIKSINTQLRNRKLGKPKLDANEEKQRPAIQFWADISSDGDKFETWKLYIIEISVPFGRGD
jgi:hypothetical protein